VTLIYLDASALVKLVVDEPESAALAEWLDDRPEQPLCTSVIGKVEVLRASRRHGSQALAVASSVLAELALVPTDSAMLELAASLEPAGLRTLDALHLASAAGLGGDLAHLVAYDDRLSEAARLLGLPVAQPGSPPA
jgi:predicted nucleic acid-binding protein